MMNKKANLNQAFKELRKLGYFFYKRTRKSR